MSSRHLRLGLLRAALALGLAAGPVAAQADEEALPLEAEAPPELASLPARTGLTLAWGLREAGPQPARYRASLAAGAWRLGLAGDGEEAIPRGALAGDWGAWRLIAGGLGGDWGQGLLLGARRRSALGAPRAPRAATLPLAPSTARAPLGRGLLLAGAGPLRRLAVAVFQADPERPELSTALGLRWRVASLDLLSAPGAAGLALGLDLLGEAGASGLAAEAGLLAPKAAPWRRGLAWRCALVPAAEPAPALRLAIEGLLLDGPQAPAASGWFGAAPGEELHAALNLPGPGAWRWRLARRLRRGIGLAQGTRRSESALALESEGRLAPVRVDVELRQVEERRAEALAAAPGFPRAASTLALRQELAVGIEGQGGRTLHWRRRLGQGGAGSLVQASSALPGFARLTLTLLRHELEAGAPAFLLYSSAGEGGYDLAGNSETRALAGRGWQAGARLRLGGPGRRLSAGGRYARRDDGTATWALWTELNLARP